MKRNLMLAMLSMVLAAPSALSKTEVEMLRALCAEQERQILQLEQENSRLRSVSDGPRPAAARNELPASTETKPPTPTTEASATSAPAVYVVRPGDSFPKISRNTGVPQATLASLNGLKTSSMIHPGQKLKLPASSAAPNSSASQVAEAVSVESSPATHKVQSGETFFSIARKHGLSADALIAANPTTKPSALRPGQSINLGGSTAPSSAAVATAAKTPNAPLIHEQAAAPQPASVGFETRIRPVMIDGEMTYGDFAAKHGTDAERLNALNGLDLATTAVLAKGSELYVPAAR